MTQKPYVVVVWGDSIAEGIEQYRWPALMETALNVVTNTGRSVKVVNEGVGGMPAAFARALFEERILRHRPDLVIVQFGFNDVRYDGSRGNLPLSTPEEFRQHLTTMANDCQTRACARVLLVGNHRTRRFDIMPDGASYEECRVRYNEITRGVARSTGVYHLDMAEAIDATGEDWKDAVTEDGVHLSLLGAYLYVQIVAAEVRRIQSR